MENQVPYARIDVLKSKLEFVNAEQYFKVMREAGLEFDGVNFADREIVVKCTEYEVKCNKKDACRDKTRGFLLAKVMDEHFKAAEHFEHVVESGKIALSENIAIAPVIDYKIGGKWSVNTVTFSPNTHGVAMYNRDNKGQTLENLLTVSPANWEKYFNDQVAAYEIGFNISSNPNDFKIDNGVVVRTENIKFCAEQAHLGDGNKTAHPDLNSWAVMPILRALGGEKNFDEAGRLKKSVVKIQRFVANENGKIEKILKNVRLGVQRVSNGEIADRNLENFQNSGVARAYFKNWDTYSVEF
jgi:hypothetical protein